MVKYRYAAIWDGDPECGRGVLSDVSCLRRPHRRLRVCGGDRARRGRRTSIAREPELADHPGVVPAHLGCDDVAPDTWAPEGPFAYSTTKPLDLYWVQWRHTGVGRAPPRPAPQVSRSPGLHGPGLRRAPRPDPYPRRGRHNDRAGLLFPTTWRSVFWCDAGRVRMSCRDAPRARTGPRIARAYGSPASGDRRGLPFSHTASNPDDHLGRDPRCYLPTVV